MRTLLAPCQIMHSLTDHTFPPTIGESRPLGRQALALQHTHSHHNSNN